jgi:uncharacterized membrane protein YgcG
VKFLKIAILLLALAVTSIPVGNVSAAVNDFEITKYDMKMELGRDNEQRSTLLTKETITAEFPQTNQNRGIERAIPASYQGHSVSLDIRSVTDEQGEPLEYTTYESNGNTVVRVGNKDTYVHGQKTYMLTYAQRDVTRYFANTDKDEFYWDLNGVEWKVPIRQFSAEVSIAPAIVDRLKQQTCYQGQAGAESTCNLTRDGATFRMTAGALSSGENVTVALGFEPETFAGYQPSLFERLLPWWIGGMIMTGVASFVALFWAGIRAASLKNRKKDIGTIAPEYLPPKDASVTTAAEVVDYPRSLLAAQLIDFAVRHYLRIIETKEKSFWSGAEYTLEITKDIATLRAEEQELLKDIFDGKVEVGQKLELKKLQNNTSLYSRMQDNPGKLKKLVQGEYALREKDASQTKWFTRLAQIFAVIGVVMLSPFTLLIAGVIWLIGYSLWPLTDKGVALRRYLDGLKMYIGVAEEARLKMLQSPEGAEKVGVGSAESSEKIVKLYEKVLPYAILFGQEKEWGKQLGDYYESTGSNPSWYAGTNAGIFNAAVLSSAMSNFSTAAAYTSASSSSSGGSGGGGSSGGGGGGGGGGGW